ncbi:MAG: SIMPL domain-containing protein [Actinomycetota bacterium]
MGTKIQVYGVGYVVASPDVVTITFGVQTRDASAPVALRRNSERMRQLIELFRSSGVPANDVHTTGVTMQPMFDPSTEQSTYTVTNMVQVHTGDVEAAAALIDAASATITDIQVHAVGFAIGDRSVLSAEARAGAVRDAMEKAAQYAVAAGVTLGAIAAIEDGHGQSVLNSKNPRTPAGAAPPIENRPSVVTESVTMLFESED